MIAGRQQGRRNAPFQKILHLLGRGFLHASSGTAGSRLQHFLVRHARQHPVFPAKRFRIFRMHADYKTGIGKWRILRARDMPLTTTSSFSVAAGTMKPPGHMQKEWTPRSWMVVVTE